MKKNLEAIRRAVKRARSAVVTTHVDPDGDAIGSMLALGMLLEKEGVNTTLYSVDGVPKIYRFLPGSDKVKKVLPPQAHFDLLFIIDSSDPSRIGNKIDVKSVAETLINIDHHPDNDNFGKINFVQPCASVAEQIFALVKHFKHKVTRAMAECLYTAIITDTGNFRYESTSVKTFQIATELLKAGVSTHELTTRIYDNKSIASIKVGGLALSTIQFTPDHKVAWATITEKQLAENGAKNEDLIGIVDRLRSIEGVEVAIFFREEKGGVKMNFRSKATANVSTIAGRFGGGGHFKAAGAIVEGPLDQVVARVIAETVKHLQATNFLV